MASPKWRWRMDGSKTSQARKLHGTYHSIFLLLEVFNGRLLVERNSTRSAPTRGRGRCLIVLSSSDVPASTGDTHNAIEILLTQYIHCHYLFTPFGLSSNALAAH